jgi:hypothetical protein
MMEGRRFSTRKRRTHLPSHSATVDTVVDSRNNLLSDRPTGGLFSSNDAFAWTGERCKKSYDDVCGVKIRLLFIDKEQENPVSPTFSFSTSSALWSPSCCLTEGWRGWLKLLDCIYHRSIIASSSCIVMQLASLGAVAPSSTTQFARTHAGQRSPNIGSS